MTSQAALSQADAASSLLSLSFAAASVVPIPIGDQSQSTPVGSAASSYAINQGSSANSSLGIGSRQHRRLASAGKTRRRLSDARDAANRPSPALLQSAAGLSLSSLSLSSSPPTSQQVSASFTAASNTLNGVPGSNVGLPASAPLTDGSNIPSSISSSAEESKGSESTPIPISVKSGRKRGVDHKCESCSKIYRHPSCLIKHRWEHTPHWREASKFVLSKHQQVQLLEAAAILSHLSPHTSSLPEDRSLWPSFLSGGSLPKVDSTAPTSTGGATHPVSSSVPAHGNFHRAPSNGPRLHDYSIPTSSAGSGVTQFRPGLVGVPTGSGTDLTASKPVPVPHVHNASASFRGYRSSTAESWSSSQYESGNTPSSFAGSAPFTPSAARSSLSISSQSRSRSGSASGSRSDDASLADVDIDVDADVDIDEHPTSRYAGRYGVNGHQVPIWKREDEVDELNIKAGGKEPDWDGMEMDMDMD
ncbi:hypothetical protein E4T56_gene18470 [Termitomyces sp. T112]|nr:hypothetical protein E4T56_gene18470 [Termitomyces sp. T112]